MKIQALQSPNFGKVYYGADIKSLTGAQKDVLDDINLYLEENNIVKRLEKICYDVYIEPRKDSGVVLDLALLNNVRFDKNNKISYRKIIMFGGFSGITGKYKEAITGLSDVLNTDMLVMKFNRFFKNYERNYYKRFVNHV